jgi:hypothetical protein
MCRALEVNRTSFHGWEHRAPSDRALTDAFLTEKIREIHAVRVAPDLVEGDFRPDGPNLTWSADITHISTWEGSCTSRTSRICSRG